MLSNKFFIFYLFFKGYRGYGYKGVKSIFSLVQVSLFKTLFYHSDSNFQMFFIFHFYQTPSLTEEMKQNQKVYQYQFQTSIVVWPFKIHQWLIWAVMRQIQYRFMIRTRKRLNLQAMKEHRKPWFRNTVSGRRDLSPARFFSLPNLSQ